MMQAAEKGYVAIVEIFLAANSGTNLAQAVSGPMGGV